MGKDSSRTSLWMKRILPAVIIIVGSMIYFQVKKAYFDTVKVGTVTGQQLIGSDADGEHVLVDITPDTWTIAAAVHPFFRFEGKGTAFDAILEDSLLTLYDQVHYSATLILCDAQEEHHYTLTRDDFNALQPGLIVKFETERKNRDAIKRLIEY